MEKMLKTKEVAKLFNVESKTVTQKFIKEGLKYFPIGARDYRFDIKDIEEFKEIRKRNAQLNVMEANPIKRKTRRQKIDIDIQKRKINLEQLKVV